MAATALLRGKLLQDAGRVAKTGFGGGRRSQRNLCGNRQRRSISKIDHYLLNLHQFPIAASCTLMPDNYAPNAKIRHPPGSHRAARNDRSGGEIASRIKGMKRTKEEGIIMMCTRGSCEKFLRCAAA